jgi:hypothetical protein
MTLSTATLRYVVTTRKKITNDLRELLETFTYQVSQVQLDFIRFLVGVAGHGETFPRMSVDARLLIATIGDIRGIIGAVDVTSLITTMAKDLRARGDWKELEIMMDNFAELANHGVYGLLVGI